MSLITEANKHVRAAERQMNKSGLSLLGSWLKLLDGKCDYLAAANNYVQAGDCYCSSAIARTVKPTTVGDRCCSVANARTVRAAIAATKCCSVGELSLAKDCYEAAISCYNNYNNCNQQIIDVYNKLVDISDDHYSKIGYYEQILTIQMFNRYMSDYSSNHDSDCCDSNSSSSSNNNVNETKLKIACLYCDNLNYGRAAEYFEELANSGDDSYVKQSLLSLIDIYASLSDTRKLSTVYDRLLVSRNYFIECLLCHLCNGDSVTAKQLATTVRASTTEMVFIDTVISAFDLGDVEMFTATVNHHYNHHSMSDIVVTLLLPRIRQRIVDHNSCHDLKSLS